MLRLRGLVPVLRRTPLEKHMNLSRWEPFKEADDSFHYCAAGALVKAGLPGVKRDDVKVTLDEGVLNVHIPKANIEKKPKAVEIQVQ
jgi:hypothetical protein